MGVNVGKIEIAAAPRKNIGFSWMNNPGVQKLLDAVSSIIANEYIETAKKNPEVFKNGGLK
ncbi:MAG: hypothetical protein COW11_03385 [Candidatus Omnitrophica bacterium CG12_big_fil_rev_8_21_14_0_65_43_15]|uniref:Uncharacterized protein n=1 Tax=Candidatus Taenaricola geysiri TaxID=1974752 RepID=A0A2J0LK43_9BACT|nr:MAG: hypothetical protein AUJ89_04020 [Candidatus Omnitrophica bacterium CG1_02_43_210]PIV11731.1 MAG: hypothetical protein COS48_04490 [Candidatus Omnitrophica bacterium CG03_land_8_20_14_0_80_43_22]PIW66410.1 MAG: hypothetical protein COW11_03385 [Candidatus Omnitrophica bacterium CG12_big_fil_rev_8_21_14_0_65_43_15]PIW80691.1 MAG: hypothetical protein COZ98_01065 [Candidatus Omnitrophica bacterium CG_4_8_14_3_um_filter_43_15]PIY84461.1 MAG: hypothetical protein COY77_02300 [Candidatus Omn